MVSRCASPSISITRYTPPDQGSLLRSLKPFSSQKPGTRIEYKLQQNQISCALRRSYSSHTPLTYTREKELLFKDKNPTRENPCPSATSSENAPLSLSSKLDIFIKFVRPYTMIGVIGNTICMCVLPVQTMADLSPRFFIGVAQAIASMVLMNLFNVAVNQISDVEIDKVNKPYLPLASGEVSMTSVVLFTILICALSVTLGYFSSPAMFYGLLAFFLTACAYSINFPLLRWKHNALGAIISVMLLRISLQTSVFFHIQQYVLGKPMVLTKSFIYAIIFHSLFSIVIATLKDLPDVNGDKANGSTNLTILIGKEKVFWGSTSLMLATYIGTVAFGATLPILKNKLVIMIAHIALAVFLWLQAKQTNLADDASTQSYYLLIWKDGHFDLENFNVGPSIPSSPGDTLCAAVSASAWVEPHGKCTIAFSLAWSSPKIKFSKGSSYNRRYTKFYGTSERSTLNLVHDALMNYKRWEEEIEKWQNPVLRDDRLPEWYKFTLFNELYFLVAGGTVWIDSRLPVSDNKTNMNQKRLTEVDHADVTVTTAKVNGNQGAVVEHENINGYRNNNAEGLIYDDEENYRTLAVRKKPATVEERKTSSVSERQNGKEDVGRLLYLEGVEYIMWCTYDVHFYASFALLALFPKIELNIQRDFAKAVLSEDGRRVKFLAEGNVGIRKVRGAVPHDLGMHDPWNEMNAYNIHDTSRWKDLNPKFVLQVYRDFAATGDMSFAVDVWPAVCAAMDYMEQFDRDGDGLIENDGFPDQTYDTWTVHGISAYCGGLWLAALEAAAAMAHQLGDKPFAEKCQNKFLKAKLVFEEKLWNGSYFNYDSGSSGNSRSIQADQLAGQWYVASSGLPSLFDDFKIRSALRKIYDFNVMKVRGGRMGAVNGMHPNGRIDETCMQSREIWTGVTYGVAATMIFAKMEEEAFTTAEGIFLAGWSEEGYGYWFQTPEGWTIDGHYRSLIYMRPLAIWAMQWALTPPKAIIEAPKINMMDRMHTSPLNMSTTGNGKGGVRKVVNKTKCFRNSVFNCSC